MADDVRERIINAIKERRGKGESYATIGADLGVPPSTVWHWERGKKLPPSIAPIFRLVEPAQAA
jgi:transcriptional regulator with XRE-family HTH domain